MITRTGQALQETSFPALAFNGHYPVGTKVKEDEEEDEHEKEDDEDDDEENEEDEDDAGPRG